MSFVLSFFEVLLYFVFLSYFIQNDYRFEYTVCDSEAQRWRVSVPKIDCQPEGERAPFRGAACSK